jgi:uncharacterized protein YrzB (UPF0473 family)
MMTMEEEDTIVVFTDDDGNEFYYREDLVIEIENKKFAVLVPVSADIADGCDCSDCNCGCGEEADTDEEGDIYIARIETDANGEETYVDPTDEEFEQVQQAYEDIIAEDTFEDIDK